MALKLGSNLDLSKVVKSLGQKYHLVPYLEMELGKGDFEWEFTYAPKVHDYAWHPSGDCTPSLLDLYRKATGQIEPQPLTATSYKNFMVGHFWHQYLQWIVQRRLGFARPEDIERRGKRGWGVYSGGQYAPYHWARGSADIAPLNLPDGQYAVDFKTMNSRTFATGPNPELMAKWECQGNIYLDFFDLERIILLGICKDTPHDMKEWVFERNQPLVDAIYGKWKLVSACLDEQIEPPEDEDVTLPLRGPIT